MLLRRSRYRQPGTPFPNDPWTPTPPNSITHARQKVSKNLHNPTTAPSKQRESATALPQRMLGTSEMFPGLAAARHKIIGNISRAATPGDTAPKWNALPEQRRLLRGRVRATFDPGSNCLEPPSARWETVVGHHDSRRLFHTAHALPVGSCKTF